jgi:hypothetical protein
MELVFSNQVREECVLPGDHLTETSVRLPRDQKVAAYFCYTHFLTMFRSKMLKAMHELPPVCNALRRTE